VPLPRNLKGTDLFGNESPEFYFLMVRAKTCSSPLRLCRDDAKRMLGLRRSFIPSNQASISASA
jgi:hypothetical protein